MITKTLKIAALCLLSLSIGCSEAEPVQADPNPLESISTIDLEISLEEYRLRLEEAGDDQDRIDLYSKLIEATEAEIEGRK